MNWLFIGIVCFFLSCVEDSDNDESDLSSTSEDSQVCYQNECYIVEVADSAEERSEGLMNRDSLADGYGMLFVFDTEETYSFWMNDTLISLDIIWIDNGFAITTIESVDPCETETCETYEGYGLYVLEINKGQAEAVGLSVGSILEFKNLSI